MTENTVRYICTSSPQDFLSSGAVFGVMVARIPEYQNLHSGVVFRRSGTIPRVGYVHVKWDHCLGVEWDVEGVWASPPTHDMALRDKLLSAAELSDSVRRKFKAPKPNGLPYGIGWNGSTFEYQDGQLTLNLGDGSFGLTCATLPLAICKSSQIELVVEGTWEVREQDDWRLLDIAKQIGDKDVVERISAEIASKVKRIRPEEVTAAAAHVDAPVDFALSVDSGVHVVSLLPSNGRNGVATSTRVTVTRDPTPA
jgi:hypothetical protein